jgi:hypothetical protein
MASYPTTAVTFPLRADGQTIFSAHMNLVQEEIAAMEAALITAAGQTNAEVRIRRNGNCLEWGHVNPAGYGNMLGDEHGTGQGFIAFNGEAGTNPGLYRTRGIPATILRGEGGVLTAGYAPLANADNQTRVEYLKVGLGGIFERGRAVALGGWQNFTYAAGNFTSDTGTWVVESGDVIVNRYTFIGATCIYCFYFANTTITGTPQVLRVTLPFPIQISTRNMITVINNSTQVQPGFASTGQGSPIVNFYRDNGLTLYAASANTTSIFGQIAFEIG